MVGRIDDTGKYHKEFTDITWEQCSLRKYLNGKFLRTFDAADRAKIIETRITNRNNPIFGTSGGKDTKDFIFLLDLDEVKRFFPANEDRTILYNGSVHWWWLRSPGHNNARAVKIKDLGGASHSLYADGVIDEFGERIALDGGGIRPSLWMRL